VENGSGFRLKTDRCAPPGAGNEPGAAAPQIQSAKAFRFTGYNGEGAHSTKKFCQKADLNES
jgi:hypothetical protein